MGTPCVLMAIRDRLLCAALVEHVRALRAACEVVVRPDRAALATRIERLRPQVLIVDLDGSQSDARRSTVAGLRERLGDAMPGLIVLVHGLEDGVEAEARSLGADACLHAEHATREAIQANVRWLLAAAVRPQAQGPGGGTLRIARGACTATVRGSTVVLTPMQSEIVWRLASEAPGFVSPRDLLDGGQRLTPCEASALIQDHVWRLRRRLGPHANIIRTIRGRGYQLAIPAVLLP